MPKNPNIPISAAPMMSRCLIIFSSKDKRLQTSLFFSSLIYHRINFLMTSYYLKQRFIECALTPKKPIVTVKQVLQAVGFNLHGTPHIAAAVAAAIPANPN